MQILTKYKRIYGEKRRGNKSWSESYNSCVDAGYDGLATLGNNSDQSFIYAMHSEVSCNIWVDPTSQMTSNPKRCQSGPMGVGTQLHTVVGQLSVLLRKEIILLLNPLVQVVYSTSINSMSLAVVETGNGVTI